MTVARSSSSRRRLGAARGRPRKCKLLLFPLIGVLICNGNLRIRTSPSQYHVSVSVPYLFSSDSFNHVNYDDDGCGLIDNSNSSTWIEFTPLEKNESTEIQKCLRRIGRHKFATSIGRFGLQCRDNITLEILRSTLARYETVWLHGDSIMEQTFYTLACMMNLSVTMPHPDELGGEDKMQWTVGLGEQDRMIERFAHSHAQGQTEFRYSRYGLSWGMQDNLYKHDFPYSVNTLTSKDTILTTGASAHYTPAQGTEMERALEFMASQSKVANASMFLIEPTPEEWPTSNGFYTPSCMWRCQCEALTDEHILGHGQVIELPDPEKDKEYGMGGGKPDRDFFQRLYPNIDPLSYAYNNKTCVPNCLPGTWRLDLVRQFFSNATSDENDIHLVPIYWQLLSSPEGSTSREKGDCTHRNFYATELMLFQWIRTILG